MENPVRKQFIFKRRAGSKDRYAYTENGVVSLVDGNQFFYIYSDGSKKVRDIEIDYADYKCDTYDDMKKNIGKNIARLRKEKNMSCEDVANEVYVSRQYIAQIEKGERNVSLDILSKIAEALEVDVGFLIRKNPFRPSNIYIDKLVAEIRELDLHRQKELCAEIIERLWIAYQGEGRKG